MPDAPLRLTQRDDGTSPTTGHARLAVSASSPNQPSSTQAAQSIRLGHNNTYS